MNELNGQVNGLKIDLIRFKDSIEKVKSNFEVSIKNELSSNIMNIRSELEGLADSLQVRINTNYVGHKWVDISDDNQPFDPDSLYRVFVDDHDEGPAYFYPTVIKEHYISISFSNASYFSVKSGNKKVVANPPDFQYKGAVINVDQLMN